MKAYLITTGTLFGLLALVHVWRAIAEWPRPVADHWFALEMAVTIVLPGLLSSWAWWLSRKLSGARPNCATSKGSDGPAT